MVAWVRIAARYTPEGDTEEGLRMIVRLNRTLTLRGMTVLFAGIPVVVLTIGLGFTLAAVWLVFPFAGLEMMMAPCCTGFSVTPTITTRL